MSIQESIRYGSAELKAIYNRNLGVALAISVGFHLALIFLYVFSLNIGKAKSEGAKPPVNKVKLTTLAPPPAETEAPPPPPPPMIPPQMQGGGGGGGVASRAGTPVPVPDALIAPDVKFSATTEISVATPEMGDGTGVGPKMDGDGLGGGQVEIPKEVKVKETEKLPSVDEFVAVEEEAAWDREGLQRRLKYPEMAIRAGVEGEVILRVLVNKSGKVENVIVDRSDNKVLEQAAVDAAKKTPFSAAKMGNQTVASWVQVDVHFKLQD